MFNRKAPGVAGLAIALVLGMGGCAIKLGDEPAEAQSSAPATSSPASSPASAANGIDQVSATEAIANAREATSAAAAVRVNGLLSQRGERYTMDFRFQGQNSIGKMWIGVQSIEMIKIGRTIYFKGNDAFWQGIGGQRIVRAMRRKWLKTTTGDRNFSQIAAFTSLPSILTDAMPAQGWNKGVTENVGGDPAIAFTSAQGEKVHVATQGKPYILLLDSGQQGRLTFSAYDQSVEINPPPANLIVDV